MRTCQRLWLEIHRPNLREDSAATQASFQAGDTVGEIAGQVYDPGERGVLFDAQRDGFDQTFRRSAELLASDQPIFEAGFAGSGGLAFADVMLPVEQGGRRCWRMIEVKSPTGVT